MRHIKHTAFYFTLFSLLQGLIFTGAALAEEAYAQFDNTGKLVRPTGYRE